MEHRKRIYIFITFFLCTISLALLTLSLSTHHWIESNPIRLIAMKYNNNSLQLTSTISSLTSDNGDDDQQSTNDYDVSLMKKFRGQIYFGLFQGTKILNYGLGDRTTIIWLKQEMLRNPNMMSFTLWLLTLLSISIAMIFSLISAIFAIINTVMTPIETITGVQGLYLWNFLASSFCILATIIWLIQYRLKLAHNLMTDDEQNDGWTSYNRSNLGYSYYIIIIVIIIHFLNMFLIYYGTTILLIREHHRQHHDHLTSLSLSSLSKHSYHNHNNNNYHNHHHLNHYNKNHRKHYSNNQNGHHGHGHHHHHHHHNHHHHNDKNPEGLIMLY